METTSIYSANRPPPLSPSPPPPPLYTEQIPPQPQYVEQPQPQYIPYYEPEPEKTFVESISKKVLFIIFLAFIVGLLVGKFMSQATIVNLK